jgi:non-heme chloroperoxidase
MKKLQFTVKEGIRLAADSVGTGSPVVLLHGGGQTRGAWHRTARALADRGYRAIAVDLRGHGESDWSKVGYDLDLFVEDLRSILPEVGGKPALIGASLGGLTSLLTVGESDMPLAGALVLVDIATEINPEGREAIRAFMTGNPDGFASVEEAADAVARYIPHRPRPKDVSGLNRNLRRGENGRLYWHWDPAMVLSRRVADPAAMTARLDTAAGRLAIPTLLVWGGHSEIVTPVAVEKFKRVAPRAEIAKVAEAGHMIAGDSNTIFAKTVLEFLGRVYPA